MKHLEKELQGRLMNINRKIKRHIKRNVIWFLLKFKKSYKNADCEGDYSTVITAKLLFGDIYIMQTESYFKDKRTNISKLEKKDILPDSKKVFNPFEEMQRQSLNI